MAEEFDTANRASEVNKSTYRNWVFTWNNYGEAEWLHLNMLGMAGEAKFLTFKKERGTNGTPHIQGMACMDRAIRVSGFIKWLKGACEKHPWVAPMRGSPEQARDYVHKTETAEGEPITYGVLPQQGKRNDLAAIKAAVSSGARTVTAIEETAGVGACAYVMGWAKQIMLEADHKWVRECKPYVRVLYGDSNVGKSHMVMEMAKAQATDNNWRIYELTPKSEYWNGYDGQEIIVMNEFDGSSMTRTMFNSLMDMAVTRVKTFYGMAVFKGMSVYITSNDDPVTWWDCKHSTLKKSYLRRIDNVCLMKGSAWQSCTLTDVTDGLHKYIAELDRDHKDWVLEGYSEGQAVTRGQVDEE